jgi:hypothetical protein
VVSNGTLWTEIRLPMREFRKPKGLGICLRITVFPVRIRVPPLVKILQIARKKGLQQHCRSLCQRRVNSRIKKGPLLVRLCLQSRMGIAELSRAW